MGGIYRLREKRLCEYWKSSFMNGNHRINKKKTAQIVFATDAPTRKEVDYANGIIKCAAKTRFEVEYGLTLTRSSKRKGGYRVCQSNGEVAVERRSRKRRVLTSLAALKRIHPCIDEKVLLPEEKIVHNEYSNVIDGVRLSIAHGFGRIEDQLYELEDKKERIDYDNEEDTYVYKGRRFPYNKDFLAKKYASK